MKQSLLALCIILTSCAGSGPKWLATGNWAARKLGPTLAQIVITSAVQSLTSKEQASYLDSAAAGLRTVAGSINQDDVAEIVTIWSTPRHQETPPEMAAVAAKVSTVKASPEALAVALNDAAKIVRTSAGTP